FVSVSNTGTGNRVMTSGIGFYSELKTITVDQNCYNYTRNIQWLNNNGGFDPWLFTGRKTYQRDLLGSSTQKINVFPQWPKTFNEFADTQTQNVSRSSKVKETIRTQNLTRQQADDLAAIKSSPLVQIVNSAYDVRTVIV